MNYSEDGIDSEISLKSRHVLVLEDDIGFNQTVCLFLEDLEVNAIGAYTIAEGLEKIRNSHFDFILLDGSLPDGRGADFLKGLSKLDLVIPVMMITAEENQEEMAAYFGMGVDDYLLKPVNFGLIWLKMRRLYRAHIISIRERTKHKKLQELLNEKHLEEDLGRHVYKHLAGEKKELDHIIKSSMQSSGSFNGDFFLSLQGPSGNTFLMLLDATGHGLAAAISVLLQVAIMRAMVEKGFTLPSILFELNKKFNRDMPLDRFVAAVLMEIDHTLGELYIWNGSMPDVLILDNAGKIIRTVCSGHMAIGIMEPEEFDASLETIHLTGGEHLVMHSDGLVEQIGVSKQVFDTKRLAQTIERCDEVGSLFDFLLSEFESHRGVVGLGDDVSLCYINLDLLTTHLQNQSQIKCFETGKKGHFDITIKINGDLLAKADIVDLLNSVMNQSQIAADTRQTGFTLFSELVSNALDHGVLGIDSEIKNNHERFIEYLELREQRLQNLSQSDEIKLHFSYNQSSGQIDFEILDSGEGYDPSAVNTDDETSLAGRGLALIKQLAHSVECPSPGNKTSIILNEKK